MDARIILWPLLGIQLAGYAWYFTHGGYVSRRQFVGFCLTQIAGQVGASVECLMHGTWGTMVVQATFFLFTVVGIIRRTTP